MNNLTLKSASLIACILLIGLNPNYAQDTKKRSAQGKKKPNPVFASITDNPSLPRVLLIGDSISIGYTLPTRKLLEGKVNVHRPPTNCGPTSKGLSEIDTWLGEGKWDVIHFNWGLHDLKYITERGGLAKAPDQGKQQIPIEQYRANLEQLVKRLTKTDAVLIWRNTTPVPEGAAGRAVGDSKRYNEAAAKVMKKYGVRTHDMYNFVMPRIDEIMRPANVHFTPEGSEALAETVAAEISQVLK